MKHWWNVNSKNANIPTRKKIKTIRSKTGIGYSADSERLWTANHIYYVNLEFNLRVSPGSRNVIWLQATAPNIYTFAVLFVKNFVFPTYFVSHYCWGRVLYAWILCSMKEFVFQSRAAPFNSGLANWSCMFRDVEICQRWSVGLHGFLCYVDTLIFVIYVLLVRFALPAI